MAGLFFLLRFVLLVVLISWLGRVVRRWLSPAQKTAKPTIDTLQKCPVCQHYLTAQSEPCGRADCPRKGAGLSAILLAFVFLFGLTNSAVADSGGRYLAQVDGENVTVSLFVNEIPVQRWTLDKAGTAGASLNHWLRQGANTIRIKASVLQAGQPASFHAHAWFMGVASAGGLTTVDLLNLDGLPKSADGSLTGFNVPSAPALALWSADHAEPDEKAITKAITEFCSSFASAVAAGQAPLGIAPLALEHQDNARAYGGTATLQQLDLAGQNQHANIEVSSTPRALDLSFDPVLQTGVIRVARKDGTPLFAARVGGETVTIPALLVGRKGGVWLVLRRSF